MVDELYGLDPADFTARRDQLASEAGKDGDRDLAGAIRALRRPSAAAATVNLMARVNGDEIGRLIELGARMREAQAALSGEEIRALGRQRSQLVAGLAQEARRATHDAGRPISQATEREVRATFEAALADEAAGDAVRAGRLVRALERAGMEPVNLEGAVAGTGRPRLRPVPSRTSRTRTEDEAGEEDAEGQQRRADERAARAARAAEHKAQALEKAERAEDEARQVEARRDEASAKHDEAKRGRVRADDVVHRLEEQLARARTDLDQALETERIARRALGEVEDEVDRARWGARRARAEADSIEP